MDQSENQIFAQSRCLHSLRMAKPDELGDFRRFRTCSDEINPDRWLLWMKFRSYARACPRCACVRVYVESQLCARVGKGTALCDCKLRNVSLRELGVNCTACPPAGFRLIDGWWFSRSDGKKAEYSSLNLVTYIYIYMKQFVLS